MLPELSGIKRQVYDYLKNQDPKDGEPFLIDDYSVITEEIWGSQGYDVSTSAYRVRCKNSMHYLVKYGYIRYIEARDGFFEVEIIQEGKEPTIKKNTPPVEVRQDNDLNQFEKDVYSYLKDKAPDGGGFFMIGNYQETGEAIWGKPTNGDVYTYIYRCRNCMQFLNREGYIQYQYQQHQQQEGMYSFDVKIIKEYKAPMVEESTQALSGNVSMTSIAEQTKSSEVEMGKLPSLSVLMNDPIMLSATPSAPYPTSQLTQQSETRPTVAEALASAGLLSSKKKRPLDDTPGNPPKRLKLDESAELFAAAQTTSSP